MRDFEDRVAVVTGAASGIGLATAHRFADEGMHLVLADIEEGALGTRRHRDPRQGRRRAGEAHRRDVRASGERTGRRGFRPVRHGARRVQQRRRRCDGGDVAQPRLGGNAGRLGVDPGGQPHGSALRRARLRSPHVGQRRRGPHREHRLDRRVGNRCQPIQRLEAWRGLPDRGHLSRLHRDGCPDLGVGGLSRLDRYQDHGSRAEPTERYGADQPSRPSGGPKSRPSPTCSGLDSRRDTVPRLSPITSSTAFERIASTSCPRNPSCSPTSIDASKVCSIAVTQPHASSPDPNCVGRGPTPRGCPTASLPAPHPRPESAPRSRRTRRGLPCPRRCTRRWCCGNRVRRARGNRQEIARPIAGGH